MLPVSALAVGLVAVLALVFPGVREQVALSASHQPQEYVALSFARSAAGTVTICRDTGADLPVMFTVESGLREEATIEYVVTAGTARRDGSVTLQPGESTDVTHVLHRPGRNFDLTITLPGEDRRILAHCRGAKR